MSYWDDAKMKLSEMGKDLHDITADFKLNMRKAKIEFQMDKMYSALGEACYKAHIGKLAPEELDALYAELDEKNAEIASIEASISALKGLRLCPGCEEEVDANARFCPNCGVSLTEKSSADTTDNS